MSIADCGYHTHDSSIIPMLVYEGLKCTEPTREYDRWFVIVSYLDIFHTYSDVSITLRYQCET
jgi:hypothetical protein